MARVGRGRAREADELVRLGRRELLEQQDRVLPQRAVRQLREVVEVVVDRWQGHARFLGERLDVGSAQPILHGDDSLRSVRLEQERLDLETVDEIRECRRRLLHRTHRVRQRHLAVGAHEQDAHIELHRHELVDGLVADAEALLELVDERRDRAARRQRRRRPDRLIRRREHRLCHEAGQRRRRQCLTIALVGAHRGLVEHEDCLVGLELLGEPCARRHVRDEAARWPDHLLVPLAHPAV
mmetsp:Transcript_34519/g.90842  ORF Transcript_34519/g.90842 Transcript_34519/m.90842 type:complete len:240 (+) Transcript_34519:1333-2052(+)